MQICVCLDQIFATRPDEIINVLCQEINAMVKEDFEIDYFLEATKNFVRNQLREELRAKIEAEVRAEIEAKVRAKIEAEVTAKCKDEMTRKLLKGRLGPMPQWMEDYLQMASIDQLDNIFDQALYAEAYDDLSLPGWKFC